MLRLDDHDAIMDMIQNKGAGTFIQSVPVVLHKNDWWSSYLILQDEVAPGFYYFTAKQGNYEDGCFVQVTSKNAYVTVDEDEMLVWLAEANNDDMTGDILLDGNRIGRCDSQGLANIEIALEQEETAILSYFNGVEEVYIPTDIRKSYDRPFTDYYSYLYSDRKIYRTSDTIHLTGFINNRKGLDVDEVTLKLRYEDSVFQEITAEVSEIGTFEAAYTYEGFNYRYMSVDLCVGEDVIQSLWLYIADFEKPTYALSSSIDKDFVMQGETFTYYGAVTYYDGTPLSDGQLDIQLPRNDFSLKDEDGKAYRSGVKETENGELSQTLKAYSSSDNWRPTALNIRMTARNLQEFYHSTSSYIYVFPKTMMIETTGEEMDSNTFTVTADCHRIDTGLINDNIHDPDEFRGEVVSGKELNLTVTETYYEKIFVRQTYSEIYKEFHDVYRYVKHQNVVHRATGITDANGQVTFGFDEVLEDRYYKYEISCKDDNNSHMVERGYFGRYQIYLEDNVPYYRLDFKDSDTPWYEIDYNSTVELELLKKEASIEENSDDRLLVIEERDGINHYKLTDKTWFGIVFDESRVPDTFCKVVYFNGQTMVTNYLMQKNLVVNKETRELDIDVKFDRERYSPGMEVNYVLDVKDHESRPVDADVNVSVVDEAVLPYRKTVPIR